MHHARPPPLLGQIYYIFRRNPNPPLSVLTFGQTGRRAPLCNPPGGSSVAEIHKKSCLTFHNGRQPHRTYIEMKKLFFVRFAGKDKDNFGQSKGNLKKIAFCLKKSSFCPISRPFAAAKSRFCGVHRAGGSGRGAARQEQGLRGRTGGGPPRAAGPPVPACRACPGRA